MSLADRRDLSKCAGEGEGARKSTEEWRHID